MTTEFWVMILGLAALVVIYNVSSNATLTLWRTTALGTLLAGGYILSRGFAKSGSTDRRWTDDY
jgi:hypothetical protein